MPKVKKTYNGKYVTMNVRDDDTLHVLFKDIFSSEDGTVKASGAYNCGTIIPITVLYNTVSEICELFNCMKGSLLRQKPSRKSIMENGKMYIEIDYNPTIGFSEDNYKAYLRTNLTPDKFMPINVLYCEHMCEDIHAIINDMLADNKPILPHKDDMNKWNSTKTEFDKRLYINAIIGTIPPDNLLWKALKDKSNLTTVLYSVMEVSVPISTSHNPCRWRTDMLSEFDLDELESLYIHLDKIVMGEIK